MQLLRDNLVSLSVSNLSTNGVLMLYRYRPSGPHPRPSLPVLPVRPTRPPRRRRRRQRLVPRRRPRPSKRRHCPDILTRLLPWLKTPGGSGVYGVRSGRVPREPSACFTRYKDKDKVDDFPFLRQEGLKTKGHFGGLFQSACVLDSNAE